MEKLRLDKLLAKAGLGTRKEVKRLIKKEELRVNDQLIKDPGFIVKPQEDRVSLNNKDIHYKEFYYFMLNKPQGYVSARIDSLHPTIMDLVPLDYSHLGLFLVGRLDLDTLGLIIITNDGVLSHSLSSPKRAVPKTYLVEVRGLLTDNDVNRIAEGLDLGDFTSLPGQLKILEAGPISKAELTITEGKFHQVKRMFLDLNKEVIYLKRIRLAGLELDKDLEVGQLRELSPEEVIMLKKYPL